MTMLKKIKTFLKAACFFMLSPLFIFIILPADLNADCSGEVGMDAITMGSFNDKSDGPFTDNGDGTVTDLGTGLMWQQADTNAQRFWWGDACEYCDASTLAGYTDWELPDIYALRSLIVGTQPPTINADYFPDCKSSNYWSGSSLEDTPEGAWLVSFPNGTVSYYSKTESYDVRCVRKASVQSDELVISITTNGDREGEVPFDTSFVCSIISGTEPFVFTWDFGDNSGESNVQNPNHTYTTPGQYRATCTVTDADGQTDQKAIDIYVTDTTNPILSISNKTGQPGDEVTLSLTLIKGSANDVASISTEINYDSALLHFVSVAKSANQGADQTVSSNLVAPGQIIIGAFSYTSNDVSNGEVADITFRIDSFAALGQEVALTLTPDGSDSTGKAITMKADNGKITISYIGDCNADGNVSISEVQSAIAQHLNLADDQECNDKNGDGDVSIDELQTITNNFRRLFPIDIRGSIDFISADPAMIALQGLNTPQLPSSSTLGFLVKDEFDNPKPNQTVNFELTTTVGDITLSNDSAVSNAQGNVEVIVYSGSIPTHVRVRAFIPETSISVLSDNLTISTGLPDQDSFSLSADIFNPEAWNYDGEPVTLTIRAADHFNNPVPDGTAISFITEGGVIDPSCTTVNGACSVEWRSQAPRPVDGRVTILATTVGEESFTDLNGTGRFESGDVIADMPEAFLDSDEDGNYSVGTEEFFDFNLDGQYTPGNGLYNGTLCDDTVACTDQMIHVRESFVLSMSGSFANTISILSPAALAEGASALFQVIVSDVNGNSMPNGTTVTLTASSKISINAPASFTVQNTTFPNRFFFSITAQSVEAASSEILTITVTTPKGNTTTNFQSITVTDVPAPAP